MEDALKEQKALDLTYILYSQSTYVLHAQLNARQQISAAAYPRDKENVFIVTIDNPVIPPEVVKDLRPGLTGRAKLELGRRAVVTFHRAQALSLVPVPDDRLSAHQIPPYEDELIDRPAGGARISPGR